jgi:hypothetical protein
VLEVVEIGGNMRYAMLLLCLTTVFPAMAAPEPIGRVKTVSGEAFVISDKARVRAEIGTPVFQGSVLKTGQKSSLGVTFKDETIMSFGPDTELTVDTYLYAPAQGKVKFGSTIAKGSLNYVSGAIAKLQPDAVSVTTPSGIIGVRGTQFVVKVK